MVRSSLMDDRPPLRDYGRSRAVLMGTWEYEFLPSLPAAEHSLRRIEQLLAGPLCGWPRERMLVLPNVPSPGDLPDRLMAAFEDVSDVAVFYFAGHGLISPDGQLFLGLTRSRPGMLAAASLPFDMVRDALLESRATVKIVILDCSLSGRATAASLAAGLADDVLHLMSAGTGAYTIATASAWNAESGLAQRQMSFTEYLADLVEAGIPGQPSALRLDALFNQLRHNLAADGRPIPPRLVVGNAGDFVFAYNAAPPTAFRDLEQERLRHQEQERLGQQELTKAEAELRQLS